MSINNFKKFVLEEIIDPLAVRYLLSRKDSRPWAEGVNQGLNVNFFHWLEHYRTPSQQQIDSHIGERGERVFGELHTEIRAQHPEDGVAVIDIEAREWVYVSCLAEGSKAAKKMKNPGAVYFRPCYNITPGE